tara:strand:+ start:484 stop:1416 length:933 start_codon:yes stop_codon:yes gene_type:complete
MASLICGSLAFDLIMTFEGRFSDVLLPDQLHKINAAFLIPELKQEYGGCAGNIAYNLNILEEKPLIMATLGKDGHSYLQRLKKLDITTYCISIVDSLFTAQAFITTDLDNNQITAFHPGAMNESQKNKISDAGEVDIAIISPDGREGMLSHAEDCFKLGIPFIFDPGQGLPMFNKDELLRFIDLSSYLIVNSYESELLQEKTTLSKKQLSEKVKSLIVTHGKNGAELYLNNEHFIFPAIDVKEEVDPTGCGDAFRAGMIYGITNNLQWKTTMELSCLMGAIKISSQGGQNHKLNFDTVKAMFFKNFKYNF